MNDNKSIIKYVTKYISFHRSIMKTVVNPAVPYLSHYHPQYEIMQLIEGDVTYVIDSKHYKMSAGDIIIVKKNDFHMVHINSSVYNRRVVEFDSDFLITIPAVLSNILKPFDNVSEIFCNYISAKVLKETNINNILDRIEVCIKEKVDTNIFLFVYIIELLLEIKKISKTNNMNNDNLYVNPIVVDIVSYTDKNISSKITLDNLSKHLNMTKCHLSRVFKKMVGTSIANYVMIKKILHAETLIESGIYPTEVCYKLGFNSYSNFYVNYKKILNKSPRLSK